MGTLNSSIEGVESIFSRTVSPESLFSAWETFRQEKRGKKDVMKFESNLEHNLFSLHRDLTSGSYRHGAYVPFTIFDPKQRLIHKASVRDRIVHHAVFAALNPIFEPTFIAHSFSCRVGKGTHRGVDSLETILRKVSRNYTNSCFALKCDIHRFFASVDHDIVLALLQKKIKDERVAHLLQEIIQSFPAGIPIGNLTSQLFANVYMYEFDQFMKHILKVKHYIRYTDDFVIVAEDESHLQSLLPHIKAFLRYHLRLQLHPHKVTIRKYRQGIDFLGYILLPHHRVLRTKTRRRIFRKLHEKSDLVSQGICSPESFEQSLQSYLGVLSHANTYGLRNDIRNIFSL